MARVLLSAQHCLPTDVLSNVFGFAVLFQSLRSYDTAFGLRKGLCLQRSVSFVLGKVKSSLLMSPLFEHSLHHVTSSFCLV